MSLLPYHDALGSTRGGPSLASSEPELERQLLSVLDRTIELARDSRMQDKQLLAKLRELQSELATLRS